ncbi:MAG: 4Fe-4S binding protein [Desulfobacterales bacterium]
MQDVYEELQQRLDDLAVGFPKTESQVEMKILKRLFTETDAEIFLKMSPFLEPPQDIAPRLNRSPEETAVALEQMAKKGLLFRQRKGDQVRYAAVPYVVGIFEFQVKAMDRELAQDNEAFLEEALGRNIQQFKTPVLRAVPINREIVAEWPIAPYEDVMQIIEGQDIIAVAPCICRTMTGLIDQRCDKPKENCFSFGSHADYYVENGLGRYIGKEEAKRIIKQSDEDGLVMQPFNSQKVGGMCSCCGDCCGVLRSLKMQPSPAEAVQSNYYAEVNAEECAGCETCLDRCQMDAIAMVDEIAQVDLNRCIGCGLCVTTCDTEAMQLVKKSENKQYLPPESGTATYIRIAQERGKI